MKTITASQAVQGQAVPEIGSPESAVPGSVAPESVAPKFAAPAISINRILKIATCPSLSSRSTLTYHIGCTRQGMANEHVPTASEVQIRVFANSAAGFFSSEWVSLDVIQLQFAKEEKAITSQNGITSALLFPLFKGKSANTPAFLFAVLKSEGLVRAVKDAKRLFEVVDTGAFMAAFKALMASGVDLQVEEKLAKSPPPLSEKSAINDHPAIKPKAAPVTKPGKVKARGNR